MEDQLVGSLQDSVGRTNTAVRIQTSKKTCSYTMFPLLFIGDMLACSGIPEVASETKVDHIHDRGGRGRWQAHDEISRLYVAMYKGTGMNEF